jgi:hypothetical protein
MGYEIDDLLYLASPCFALLAVLLGQCTLTIITNETDHRGTTLKCLVGLSVNPILKGQVTECSFDT